MSQRGREVRPVGRETPSRTRAPPATQLGGRMSTTRSASRRRMLTAWPTLQMRTLADPCSVAMVLNRSPSRTSSSADGGHDRTDQLPQTVVSRMVSQGERGPIQVSGSVVQLILQPVLNTVFPHQFQDPTPVAAARLAVG